MTRVFLVRHAIARERNPARWPDDALRPLTADGKRRFRKGAKALAKLIPRSAVLLTSPYLRARDTARILARATRCKGAIECPELSADAAALAVFALIRRRPEQSIVLVGHEPNLGVLLAAALNGKNPQASFEFKKGGAACMEFARIVAPGRGVLRWFFPPRLLRVLRS